MNSSPCWKKCSPDRLRLGRLTVLVLVLALAWLAPVPAIAQDACGEFAVAVAPQTPGHPLSDNVVSLMTPADELSSGDFAEPLTVEPSPKPGVALVRSLGGIYGLMDVATGEIKPLQIPEEDQPRLTDVFPTVQNAARSDFMLLAEIPHAVWLVELSTGDAVDLTTLGSEDSHFIDSAAISPDGKWVIFSLQDEGFLISLETPGEPTPIDSEPILPFPAFDDQSDVIYGVDSDLLVSIRSLDPETGERTDLAAAPDVRLMPIQLSQQLLLLGENELLTYEVGAMTPRTLFEWQGDIATVRADTTGTHLLIGDEIGDTVTWHWIDIATGAQTELVDLAGMVPMTAGQKRDAVLFAPTVRIGPGVPGAPYRTLDLTTGSVATALEQDSDDVWQVTPGGDDAGRYTIVNAVSPGSGRLWLIDNQTGTATQIGTSTGNAKAVVSPDGCQLAVSIYDTIGEGRTSSVTVASLVDGTTLESIPDALLLGWAAVESTG